MNKKAFTAATVILGLIGVSTVVFFIVVIYFDKIDQTIGKYIISSMHKKQTIAENVQVTTEWTEITSEQLLEPTKQVQKVQLLIKNYKDDIQNPDYGNIMLSDGTKVKPEIEIIDENGKVYKLKDGSRNGDSIGFSVDKKSHGSYSFPKDVKYKTIRIRSDEPFQCEKIIWYDHDMK